MSKKVDFKLNLPGLNEVMRGPAMQGILREKGNQVAGRAKSMCPEGEYKAVTRSGRWIAVTWVSADNYEAAKDNSENNTLLKALHGGGKG